MSASWQRQALLVCAKDLRTEFRERVAISSVVLFSVTSLVVVGFALSGLSITPDVGVPLMWIVLFYAAFSGLAHVFAEEEEGGTSEALRMAARPEAVFAGKLLYNLALLGTTSVITVPLFLLITELAVPRLLHFAGVVAAGVAALAAAATIVGAIVAKARARGALFGALGFPVVLPLLMMAVVATRRAVGDEVSDWSWLRDVGGMAAYAVMMVTASVLVFPAIWEGS